MISVAKTERLKGFLPFMISGKYNIAMLNKESEAYRHFLFYLVGLFLFNIFVINTGIVVFGQDKTQLTNINRVFMVDPKYSDSWDPMFRSLRVFFEGEDPTIYQKVFFNQKHKFQYPPTSLVIVDVLRKIFDPRELTGTVIDWISWFCLWGTILFSIMIFFDACHLYFPENCLSTWVKIGLAVLLALSGLTFYPINRAFFLGQIQIWLDLFFAISLWLWLKNKESGSSVFLGLMSVIKPQMGLFVIWGLLRKRWKFCAGIVGVVTVFLLISLWRYGLPSHLKYLEVLSFIGQHGETYFPNQSVNGLMNRLLFNGNNLEWDAWHFAPENVFVRVITIVTSILLLFFAFAFNHKSTKEGWLSFATAGLVFTLASPVAWEHHYGILFPIFALVIPKVWQMRNEWKSGPFLAFLAYILTANFYLFLNRLADTPWNFLQSYLFFGALLVLGILVKLQVLDGKLTPQA